MKIEAFHNWELERALREKNIDQARLAEMCKIDPSILSYIKRGRMRPTDEEEKMIAQALKMPVEKLFIQRETIAAN